MFLTCMEVSTCVIHKKGGVVRVVHDEGGVGHIVIWLDGSEVVGEGSIRVVHETDALEGEWCGETPRSHVRIISGGVWGAPERFSTRKDTSKHVVRVDEASDGDSIGSGWVPTRKNVSVHVIHDGGVVVRVVHNGEGVRDVRS